jgi:phosphatidylglycerophosphate synthase
MLDTAVRPLIDPLLARLADRFVRADISANTVTLVGFSVGLLAVPALAAEWYAVALVFILANRLADGIDGAIARRVGATDLGGYLDILCDFIFYAAVPFGFALAAPENGAAAAFLIFSFVGTGSSFLAYAALAAKHDGKIAPQPRRSIYYLGGLTEGTETILCFAVLCLFPGSFAEIAYLFGALCWTTTGFRAAMAWRLLTRR